MLILSIVMAIHQSIIVKSNQKTFRKVACASALKLLFFSSFAAIAAEGVTFRMDCGVAGTVTADLGKQIQDDTYYFTSIYAPKLNLIKHGLWGQAGAAHFSVEDSDYTFFYGFDTYIFQLKGKEYQCKPIR